MVSLGPRENNVTPLKKIERVQQLFQLRTVRKFSLLRQAATLKSFICLVLCLFGDADNSAWHPPNNINKHTKQKQNKQNPRASRGEGFPLYWKKCISGSDPVWTEERARGSSHPRERERESESALTSPGGLFTVSVWVTSVHAHISRRLFTVSVWDTSCQHLPWIKSTRSHLQAVVHCFHSSNTGHHFRDQVHTHISRRLVHSFRLEDTAAVSTVSQRGGCVVFPFRRCMPAHR